MPLSEFPRPLDTATGHDAPEIRVAPPGPMSIAMSERLAHVECPAFGQRRSDRAEKIGVDLGPIVLASGRGSNVYDVDGNRYVDFAAGFGSVLLGHNATSSVRAIEGQAERLMQALGDVYSADCKISLLERLASLHPSGGAKALLTQSGSDAVTAAIKTAMLATKKPGLIAFEGAYHGMGYAALPACGLRESLRAPFGPQLNADVTFAPYPKGDADLDRTLSTVDAQLARGSVGAVLVEPILGRGGCVVPPTKFVAQLCDLAHRYDAVVIADEIWTGLGRSGSLVRSSAVGAAPDILCFGKGLGGGMPISACVGESDVMDAWARTTEVVHTSTHAGHPLACASAIATLDSIRFKQLVTRSRDIGLTFLELLCTHLEGANGFVEARGAGLMIGVELESGARAMRASRALLERGYIVLGGGIRGETLTMTPPLTIGEELLEPFCKTLRNVLDTID
ncbi:MAG: aspartate aminotransferase family protein [Polyangiaceae bacterium]|nr:aspartate aminotransferase family protein [Polyangiaceae bacterium]